MKIKDAKIVRETLIKTIFSSLFLNEKENNSFTMWDIQDENLIMDTEGVNEFLKEENLDDEVKENVIFYLEKFIENKNAFSSLIQKHLKEGFSLERLSKSDLAIIFVAMLELKFNSTLSEKIIVNEAVENSKRYSSENSFKFVNGILRNLVKEIRNEWSYLFCKSS